MVWERPVGEVFVVHGVEVVVVPDAGSIEGCRFCVFRDACIGLQPLSHEIGECVSGLRKDSTNVHFERYNDGHHLTRHLNDIKKSPIATDREQ